MASVLVVEDDLLIGNVLTKVLSKFGHHVVASADGIGGIARGQGKRFDVAIVDLLLPDMHGFDVNVDPAQTL